MVEVRGLSKLLRAIAGRIEGEVDGLNQELLLQSARRIELLENVADKAQAVTVNCGHSKVAGRMVVNAQPIVELIGALRNAGYALDGVV